MNRQPRTNSEKQQLEDLRCTVAARLRREGATLSDNYRNDWVSILNQTTVAPNVCMAVLDDMIKSGLSAEQILNYDEQSCQQSCQRSAEPPGGRGPAYNRGYYDGRFGSNISQNACPEYIELSAEDDYREGVRAGETSRLRAGRQ